MAHPRIGLRSTTGDALVAYAGLVCGACFFLMPFFWLVSSSLKSTGEIFVYPPRWIPSTLHWENYRDAVSFIPFVRYFVNTLLVCVVSVVGNVISASLVAYGFSRVQWKGRDALFYVMLSTLILPPQVTMIPVFVIFRHLRAIDTYVPLVLPSFFGAPFFIFLLRQFFRGIPESLSEAARMDGCHEFGIFLRVVLPLCVPALVTVALFTFIGTWVDFMGPLIYLQSPDKFTLSLGLQQFQGTHSVEWGMLMAASTLMMLPIVGLFLVAQKAFIRGIATSGLKG